MDRLGPAAYHKGDEGAAVTFVRSLDDCLPGLAPSIGGKAAGLSVLLQHQFPVPPGFVVTTDAYHESLRAAGREPTIARLVAEAGSVSDNRRISEEIGALFDISLLAEPVAKEIVDAYEELDPSGGPVAVRSSATAEDRADASFAGQQETYLWVTGADAVLRHVVRCWASLFTPQAIAYRARLDVPGDGLAMAVVVQRMIPAEAAGVMMTLEPTTGARSQIYLESALGLGEGVVRGDVGLDRFWLSKHDLHVRDQQIGIKERAHHFDPARQEVGLVEVAADEQDRPSLSADEVRAVAELGRQVEGIFAAPVDIEWAVAPGAAGRDVFLLQARPETVWSQRPETEPGRLGRPSAEPPAFDPSDAWDPLLEPSVPGLHWSTDNVGEAMPGVLTPLTWTLWGPLGEAAVRDAFWTIGAISRAERKVPKGVHERAVRVFYGRVAMQVELLTMLGDRLPGTSGQEVVKGIFGKVPDDMAYQPTRRRYPVVAWRLPRAFFTVPGRVRALGAECDPWWRWQVDRLPDLDLPSACVVFSDAAARFHRAVTLQTVGLLAVVQPLYDGVGRLVKAAGVGDIATLSGSGGAELAVVCDIWRAARGEIGLDAVTRVHGFHGPMEGELSSRVWREDPTPLRRLLKDYAAKDEATDPARREEMARRERQRMQRDVVARLPAVQRPAARWLLRAAAERIPLRGVAKRSFLQCLDIARGAARRAGECLAVEGVLDGPDDVFHLTVEELTGSLPAGTADLVRRRKDRRSAYQELCIPGHWTGMPEPRGFGPDPVPDGAGPAVVEGIGVSAGVVEGRVRVLLDPRDEVGADEILVAPTTDPSWSSVMFISAGLIVDIGGALSHAAVVARELGVPCVVNTREGTRKLRTGDRVRLDGASGTVEVLERAATPGASTLP